MAVVERMLPWRSGESYINHPLAVAQIVADIGLDEISVTAALLHDAVEDTEITVADVERDFGAEVAAIVDGVTKLERIRFDSRESSRPPRMRKMLVAMAKDLRVLVIKLADRLHNMRTIAGDAAREAAAHRPGDPRHLRPAGPPPRHAGDEAAARGPRVRRPAPEAVRRTRPPGQQPHARTRRLPRPGPSPRCAPARRARHQGRGHRSGKHLWSIYEKMVVKGASSTRSST
jgi:guanosine-3',5'-bis(diphosphate) 3'-pyrophosphohydrolase